MLDDTPRMATAIRQGAPLGSTNLRGFVLRAEPVAIRRALAEIDAAFDASGVTQAERGRLEPLLAEALHGIAERASASGRAGVIEAVIISEAAALEVELRDRGCPIWRSSKPTATCAANTALPEGASEPLQDREVAQGVVYRREDGVNIQTLRIARSTPEGGDYCG